MWCPTGLARLFWNSLDMKVFNLQCSLNHPFEGWFDHEEDYQDQQRRGLLSCPLCGDAQVVRLPSAPRLNLHSSESVASRAVDPRVESAGAPPSDAQWISAVRHIMKNTEDVGQGFSEQALRMHQGEIPGRRIRGEATPEQVRELLDEGVPLLPLPALPGLKETLQ